MKHRLGLGVAIAVCTAACSFLVDTSDLIVATPAASNDGDSGGGAVDGGGGAEGSATPVTVDEAGAPDAAVDASSPCATAHAFCDDFDDARQEVGKGWTRVQTATGPVDFDDVVARSAPRSLRTAVTPAKGTRNGGLWKSISTPGGKLHVELDVFVEKAAAGAKADHMIPVEIDFYPPPATYEYHGVFLSVRNNQTVIAYFAERPQGQGDTYMVEAPVTFALGTWQHVVFDYDIPARKAVATVGGATFEVDVKETPTPTTSVEVAVGAPYVHEVEGTWTSRVDNVVVDLP
ncbi:MAG: hypothetical protein KIT84_42355 [Labilithrix sp.]|nr:hypothetical protein [Labilithrix sp.]MCW5817719.1 hypothetical protein [Labilithrix sp.]